MTNHVNVLTDLTDDSILGDLRRSILDPPIQSNRVRTPEEYEMEVQKLREAKRQQRDISADVTTVPTYVITTKKTPKRIPRAWFAPLYYTYKKLFG